MVAQKLQEYVKSVSLR